MYTEATMLGELHIAPGLLIAMPQLRDPNFDRSVVLMIEHHEEGSFGLVLNRPTRMPVGECTPLRARLRMFGSDACGSSSR